MSVVQEKMIKIIQQHPEDASFEEILRELFFMKMIERGLNDVRMGKSISNEEMQLRINLWQK